MPNDPRARIFTPLAQFERSLAGLSPEEARKEKISFVADGISLLQDERHWKDRCVPAFWLQCLLPLLWPVLWYRGVLSKSAQFAIASAIHNCRKRWAEDLEGSGLSFDSVPDP